MVSKQLLAHKNDKVFIIGKGIFDSTAEREYIESELFLRHNGFSSIRTAAMYTKPVDPNNQIEWFKWMGRELLSSDMVYILPSEKEVRIGTFELYAGYEWCRELAHSVKIPVFFKEYEENDGI